MTAIWISGILAIGTWGVEVGYEALLRMNRVSRDGIDPIQFLLSCLGPVAFAIVIRVTWRWFTRIACPPLRGAALGASLFAIPANVLAIVLFGSLSSSRFSKGQEEMIVVLVCMLVQWLGGFLGLMVHQWRRARVRNVLVAVLLLGAARAGLAHDNKVVHPSLAIKSVDLLIGTDPLRYSEVNALSGKPVIAAPPAAERDIAGGTIQEDEPAIRGTLHFYNPQTQKGLPGVDLLPNGNALKLGTSLWNDAVNTHKSGNRPLAYFNLGRALHLIQDMTSPAHVHNDIHFSPFGSHDPIFNTQDYEHWELDNFPTLQAWTGSVGALTPPVTDYGALLVSVAKRTNEDVRIEGVLKRSASEPAVGTLKTLFPAPVYMSYIPLTGSGVEEVWQIVNVGGCFSGPDKAPQARDDWWRAEPRAAGEFYYLENIRNAIPAKVWNVTTSTYEANTSNLAIPALWAGIPSLPTLRATPTQTGFLVPRTIEAGA